MITLLLAAVLYRDSATGIATRPAVATASSDVQATVWVDPHAPPRELQPHVIAAQLRPGFMFTHGHITDADGNPVAGVSVSAPLATATTDSRGYFAMHIPSVFDRADLLFSRDGFKRHTIANATITKGGDIHFIIQMERGEGSTSRDDTHKMNLECGGHAAALDSLDDKGSSGTIDVPQTIRVGFDCPTANTCARVEVFSIDTYVKRGLNDEWIASWDDDSLMAGAVAYRSYGSYYVAHPRTATYDICSTTSCQVNDSDTSMRTDLAVDATRGYVLVSNGEIFRSEYSAENNNLLGERSCSNVDRSCGDGFAGSPAAGWPCLADGVCGGHSCFGHGRGMCQWGSQRWALAGQDWRWILNHYYNDNGRPRGLRSAFISGPSGDGRRRRAVSR